MRTAKNRVRNTGVGRTAPGPLWSCCCLAVYSLLAANDAHAYIDPGTGSMIIQIVAGAVLGATLTMKMWLFRVKAFFFTAKSSDSTKNIPDGED